MTALGAAALYMSLNGVLLVILAVRIIRLRQRYRVGIGDGGNAVLARAIRVHGNFTEYAPLALLLILATALLGYPAWVVHGLGIALTAGRVAHAVGLTGSIGRSPGRFAGMSLTFLTILVAAALCLARAFGG